MSRIIVRQKSGATLELGELLVARHGQTMMLLTIFDLSYASQVSQQHLELASGLAMNGENDLTFHDRELRHYVLGFAQPLLYLEGGRVVGLPKQLPSFFGFLESPTPHDLSFLSTSGGIVVGSLRSGSSVLPLSVSLPTKEIFSHHILVCGTTGRGKSVFLKNLLWGTVSTAEVGLLVLDPHDEYIGRSGFGLKDHPQKDRVLYYSPASNFAGSLSLRINLSDLVPRHFQGALFLTDPQEQMLGVYYKRFGGNWIQSIFEERKIEGVEFSELTVGAVKRKLLSILDASFVGSSIHYHGIFDPIGGQTTVSEIVRNLEEGCVVIVDTSLFNGAQEILVGSVLATELYQRYRRYKSEGVLSQKPVVSVVLEEAPRVLGKEIIEEGTNIFKTIAREGRKFGVGICALTQLPSLIPRQILANMNTKVIFGLEMGPERDAIIMCASHDLSKNSRQIASLNRGEAIISSTFSPFALPIAVSPFDGGAAVTKKPQLSFEGVTLG